MSDPNSAASSPTSAPASGSGASAAVQLAAPPIPTLAQIKAAGQSGEIAVLESALDRTARAVHLDLNALYARLPSPESFRRLRRIARATAGASTVGFTLLGVRRRFRKWRKRH